MMKRLLILLILFLSINIYLFCPKTESMDVELAVSEIIEVVLDDGTGFNMSVSAPSTAGLAPGDATPNTSQFLKYTSIVASSTYHKITVAGSGQTTPAGTTLTVQAAIQSGGGGVKGTEQGEVTIATDSGFVGGDFITSIGSCYTDIGAVNGAQLTYRFKIVDPLNLVVNAGRACTVTFTMVAQ
ncbi:MAG: hypothetical protein JW969_08860 [Spirochaetales bacterium]|nr:hypothetical protein [Spirochaetales bacterium]